MVVFVVGAALYVTYGIEDFWRAHEFRRLARKLGFAYLRKQLPEALSLYGTPFARRRLTWNVIDGERRRLRIVAFDCQVGEGTASWRRTVIAIRTGSDTLDAAKFDLKMNVQNSGGWSIVYYPQELKLGVIPMKELRTHLSSI